MWKANHAPAPVPAPIPSSEPVSPAHATPVIDATNRPRAVPAIQESAVIGKGQKFKGEVTGTGSLFVDGQVEGVIDIPHERVTIGQNGTVIGSLSAGMRACIVAREIVILGKVRGNIIASDRVEIRAEGVLNGDVTTSRISIADGAHFRGEVDIRKEAEIRKAEVRSLSTIEDAGENEMTA